VGDDFETDLNFIVLLRGLIAFNALYVGDDFETVPSPLQSVQQKKLSMPFMWVMILKQGARRVLPIL